MTLIASHSGWIFAFRAIIARQHVACAVPTGVNVREL